jgi:hypothetical protein
MNPFPKDKAAWAVTLTLAAALYGVDGHAAVYKCKNAAGAVSYSQTPCPVQENTVRVTRKSKSASVDCWYANKFALATAEDMQNGVASDQLFDEYGGLNALSKGTIGLISYVYSHRSNDAVSAQRVAGLATARCQARALGDVSCEALPMAFTEQFGGCGKARPEDPVATQQPTRFRSLQRQRPVSASAAAGDTANEREEKRTEQCRAKYQRQLDQLDSEMRAGYSSRQGEVYRERRRSLRRRLSEC